MGDVATTVVLGCNTDNAECCHLCQHLTWTTYRLMLTCLHRAVMVSAECLGKTIHSLSQLTFLNSLGSFGCGSFHIHILCHTVACISTLLWQLKDMTISHITIHKWIPGLVFSNTEWNTGVALREGHGVVLRPLHSVC
jgi:hypothetical protein